MRTDERTIQERANRLIRAATGENYGDGYVVMDMTTGYAEPGYGDNDSVVVFGNWNPKRFPREGEPALTRSENLGPRLADALERIGVSIEWHDEWAVCGECRRAMRTQPDSYSWQMYGAFVEDGYYCADCLNKDLDWVLENGDYLNNPRNAMTWVRRETLEGAGFKQWEPSDPHVYESGWYEGQNDDPTAILTSIRQETPEETEIVFVIDGVGQFDMRFSAWTRLTAND